MLTVAGYLHQQGTVLRGHLGVHQGPGLPAQVSHRQVRDHVSLSVSLYAKIFCISG